MEWARERAGKCAGEWPTLQEATSVKQIGKESKRTDNDEWGGKVWDGVADWFV